MKKFRSFILVLLMTVCAFGCVKTNASEERRATVNTDVCRAWRRSYYIYDKRTELCWLSDVGGESVLKLECTPKFKKFMKKCK